VIYGSDSLVPAFAHQGPIDEYRFIVNPVVLGAGKTLFKGFTIHSTWNFWKPGHWDQKMSCSTTGTPKRNKTVIERTYSACDFFIDFMESETGINILIMNIF
jgi:hypothetical protein